MIIDPYSLDFTESKYHTVKHHPVRFKFLEGKMSVKEQERFAEYLRLQLDVSIRVKRERGGMSIFMSSQQSNRKCVQYCFDNYKKIMHNFKFDNISIDLSILQKK